MRRAQDMACWWRAGGSTEFSGTSGGAQPPYSADVTMDALLRDAARHLDRPARLLFQETQSIEARGWVQVGEEGGVVDAWA